MATSGAFDLVGEPPLPGFDVLIDDLPVTAFDGLSSPVSTHNRSRTADTE